MEASVPLSSATASGHIVRHAQLHTGNDFGVRHRGSLGLRQNCQRGVAPKPVSASCHLAELNRRNPLFFHGLQCSTARQVGRKLGKLGDSITEHPQILICTLSRRLDAITSDRKIGSVVVMFRFLSKGE